MNLLQNKEFLQNITNVMCGENQFIQIPINMLEDKNFLLEEYPRSLEYGLEEYICDEDFTFSDFYPYLQLQYDCLQIRKEKEKIVEIYEKVNFNPAFDRRDRQRWNAELLYASPKVLEEIIQNEEFITFNFNIFN